MKDFAKILGSRWLIDPSHLRPLMERLAAATPEAVAAAVAAYREPQLTVVGDIAVIECNGPITHRCSWFSMWYGSPTIESLQAQFRAALQDPAVKTVVFRVDSPGGTIDMVPEFAAELYAARGVKSTIAVSDTMIASAASWLFRQCDKVVVPRSGQIGSIGAYMLHQDISKMLDEWGIKLTFIYAGKHKVEGNPYEPLSDEARAYFQGEVDQIFNWFNADMARACDVTTKVVLDTFGQGRMFYGQAAVKIGLADQVSTFDAVIGRLQGRKRTSVQASTTIVSTFKITRGRVEESGVLREMTDAELATMNASTTSATADSGVELNEDGNCADGYEKRDGKCYPIEQDGDADATAATAAANRDAVNIALALGD